MKVKDVQNYSTEFTFDNNLMINGKNIEQYDSIETRELVSDFIEKAFNENKIHLIENFLEICLDEFMLTKRL
jgi:hypothetical protein